MGELLIVSQSDLKTWNECQRRYYYSRVQNLEPRKMAVPLVRGTLLHELIQAKELGTSPEAVMEEARKTNGKLFKEELDELERVHKQSWKIYKGYVRKWKHETLNYKLVEHEIGPIQLTKYTAFMGKIDGLAEDENDRSWLVEHKSHEKYPNELFRFTNVQVLIYAFGLMEDGHKVHGVLWDYLRTKVPAKPKLLKKGGLSKAKKIDTTFEVFMKEIVKNELDPADYQDILDMLKERGDTFYKRIYLPLNKSMIKEVVEEFKKGSLQIYENREKPVRDIGKHCGWCPFYSLCQAEMMGADAEFIRTHEFRERQKRYTDHKQMEE